VDADQQRSQPDACAFRIGESTDDEFLLGDALRLQPLGASSGPIGPVASLRDDALGAVPACLGEHARPVSDDVIRVAEDITHGLEEIPQAVLALLERQPAHVRAVEMEQIEDELDQLAVAHRRSEGVLQCLEAGTPVGQYDGDLAVEQRGADPEALRRIADGGESRRPILAATAQQTHPSVDAAADAVAIVLELVQPPITGRRLRDQGGQLGKEVSGQYGSLVCASAGYAPF